MKKEEEEKKRIIFVAAFFADLIVIENAGMQPRKLFPSRGKKKKEKEKLGHRSASSKSPQEAAWGPRHAIHRPTTSFHTSVARPMMMPMPARELLLPLHMSKR